MNILRSQLRLCVVCLLATIFLVFKVMGDSMTTQNISQSADRNSEFYLQSNDPSLDSNPAYQTEVKEIERLGRMKDLKGLTRLADDIEQTWGHQTDARGYFALMDEVTSVLDSYDFGFNNLYKREELTQKYVLLTLAHGYVPLDITARLLPRLITEEKITLYKRPFSTADWVQLRSTRAPLWLQTRQRLKQSIIPAYDFTSFIFLSLPPNLEEVKNPKRAAVRQQLIQDNNRKQQRRNDQLLVRFQDKIFSPMAENEVIFYYSQPPYDLPELKRLLDTYDVDIETKQRILDQVAKNISTASQK